MARLAPALPAVLALVWAPAAALAMRLGAPPSSWCCCDQANYAPPQCADVVPGKTTRLAGGPLGVPGRTGAEAGAGDVEPGNATRLAGGPPGVPGRPGAETGAGGSSSAFCPEMDLFPGDGLGERPTTHIDDGAGCGGVPRGAAAALGLAADGQGEAQAAEAVHVSMAISESTEFLILLRRGGENGAEAEDSKLLLMSHWKVELKQKVRDTATKRPMYQLLMHLRAGEFHRGAEVASLPLSKVEQISRVNVDGVAAVELQLSDDRQLLFLPFEPGQASDAASSGGAGKSARPMDWGRKRERCCCENMRCDLVERRCDWWEVPVPSFCPAIGIELAEVLGRQLAEAKQLALGSTAQPPDEGTAGAGHGERVLFKTLSPTAFACHAEDGLRPVATEAGSGWAGGVGAEVRTAKAIEGRGLKGALLNRYARHQHLKLGTGQSCIDLVRGGATQKEMEESGCVPYAAQAGVTAVVRECLDAVGAAESANIRTWGALAAEEINGDGVLAALRDLGHEPAEEWQELLVGDITRIEKLRLSILNLMKSSEDGVWHILQRASVHAQRFFDRPELYKQNLERKMDEMDAYFWQLAQRPADKHQYPHKYNSVNPRGVVETAAYQDLMNDDRTYAETLLPDIPEIYHGNPEAIRRAVEACVKSLKCAEPLVLFRLAGRIDSADFWEKFPISWLAGLPHAPHTHLNANSRSGLAIPRSVNEAYGRCFEAPREKIGEERALRRELQEIVEQSTALQDKKDYIFEDSASSLSGGDVLNAINVVVKSSVGRDVETIGASSVQGALACYPTLFGSLGMESELRDETGNAASGTRTEDVTEVLGQCRVAPQCARLAVERIMHFNTKRWDMFGGVKNVLLARSEKDICSPNPQISANCHVFTKCFRNQVEQLCTDLPGCCSRRSLEEPVCSFTAKDGLE